MRQFTDTKLTIFVSNFCAGKLCRPITLQPSVAIAMCRKACFPQIVLLQYKAKPHLGFQNLGCHFKILRCHFDTQKRLKKHWVNASHFFGSSSRTAVRYYRLACRGDATNGIRWNSICLGRDGEAQRTPIPAASGDLGLLNEVNPLRKAILTVVRIRLCKGFVARVRRSRAQHWIYYQCILAIKCLHEWVASMRDRFCEFEAEFKSPYEMRLVISSESDLLKWYLTKILAVIQFALSIRTFTLESSPIVSISLSRI